MSQTHYHLKIMHLSPKSNSTAEIVPCDPNTCETTNEPPNPYSVNHSNALFAAHCEGLSTIR